MNSDILRMRLKMACQWVGIKRNDTMDIRSKVLSLTPKDRKRLGINKSTLWYMQNHIKEGKRIKVYGKVIGKIK